jgi:hypothetical protein
MKTNILVTIGRNDSNSQAMPDKAWQQFRADIASCIRYHCTAVFTGIEAVGGVGGVWEGIEEETAVGGGEIEATRIPLLKEDIAAHLARYDQTCAGFFPDGELIMAETRKELKQCLLYLSQRSKS